MHSLKDGKHIHDVPLEIGEIKEFTGQKKKSEIFFKLETLLSPGIVYRYNLKTPNVKPSIIDAVKLNIEGFDRNNFKVEHVIYNSFDDEKISMFIVQKNNIKSIGSKPCIFRGYGGFGNSLLPKFYMSHLFFVHDFDGIFAFACIRGGGEKGKDWHDAGRLHKKMNTFEDFKYAAKYLVEKNYTVNEKIAIYGRSNGGLLVGACITQNPELFGAAVAEVGVYDMLRYEQFTKSPMWFDEYGVVSKKEDFEYMYMYSPLHKARPRKHNENQYPSTLILTTRDDNQVATLHSLKFAATMQYINNESQENPILLQVYETGEHLRVQNFDKDTDILIFLYQVLKIGKANNF